MNAAKVFKGIKNPERILPYIGASILDTSIDIGILPSLTEKDLYSDSKYHYWQIDESETYCIEQPDDVDNELYKNTLYNRLNSRGQNRKIVSEQYPMKYQVTVPYPFVAEIPDTTIVGPHGLAITDNGYFLLPLRHNYESDRHHILFESLYYNPSESVKTIFKNYYVPNHELGTVCSMLQTRAVPETMSYALWLLEKLPKLRGVNKYKTETGDNVELLIDPHIDEFQRDYIDILGYEDDCIIWDGTSAKIDKLVQPRWERRTKCFSDIQWVKEKVEANTNYEEKLDQLPNRVLLSRENIGRRVVSNVDEILDKLAKYNFEKVFVEELSISEQVALFKNADCIIGSPGGSFANLIYANKTNVIPLTHEKLLNHALTSIELIQILNQNGFNISYQPIISSEPLSADGQKRFNIQAKAVKEQVNLLLQ